MTRSAHCLYIHKLHPTFLSPATDYIELLSGTVCINEVGHLMIKRTSSSSLDRTHILITTNEPRPNASCDLPCTISLSNNKRLCELLKEKSAWRHVFLVIKRLLRSPTVSPHLKNWGTNVDTGFVTQSFPPTEQVD